MKKSIAVILALTLSLTATLTGCGKSPSGGDAVSKAEVSEKPTIVRTNTGAEPDSLDPWKSAATDTEAIFRNVFEGLLNFDEKGALIPGLASSYKVSDDGKTYTFTLRENVKFHNGKPFTSADVLYTYSNLSGMGGEKAVSSKFNVVEKIEATDEYTFVFTLKSPSAAFLTLNTVPILPEGYTEQGTKPIGTGPYKFESYVPGQKVVLKRNTDYYDSSRAGTIDTAEVYIMTDASSVISALQSGQLDFASVSSENAELLKKDYTIYNSPQNMVQIFALNNSVKPFDDVRVRQAMNFAINKADAIQGVFGGYATELYSNFSPVMGVYYNDKLGDVYHHDVEKAKALLKEAGYENGFDMVITVPANYSQHVSTAQIFAEQLKQVGINAEIKTIEWGTWLDEVYSKAKYQATIVGLTGKLDPNDVLARYSSDYGKNFFKFSNAEYDKLIADAAVETDEAKRVEMYKQCQEILTKEAAAVYVCDPNLTIAARKDLVGYTFYPVGFTDFSKLSYSK